MNKGYLQGIQELNRAKKESNPLQPQKLKERAAAILRTFGDEDMKSTFTRLTKFKAETNELRRFEKTVAAIDLMMDEFQLKYDKAVLASDDKMPEKKEVNKIIRSASQSPKTLLVVIPIFLAIVGGAYKFGFDMGNVKFDKDKIELQEKIDSLRKHIKELEEEESIEVKGLKIENENLWKTHNKISNENDSLKRVRSAEKKNQ